MEEKKVDSKTISYVDGKTELEGFLAFSPQDEKPRPAVILCHAWHGRDPFVCQKALEIAQQGYIAFALDLYGKGVLGKSKEECSALMSPFLQNRKMLHQRLLTALSALRSQPHLKISSTCAIGFCFGGLCALDYARINAGMKGVVSMHGLFTPPPKWKPVTISAKVLALHGYDDPMVSPQQVLSFAEEMKASHADWQIHLYGNTIHGFTNPEANDPDFGIAYNPLSAKRAWAETYAFLKEINE